MEVPIDTYLFFQISETTTAISKQRTYLALTNYVSELTFGILDTNLDRPTGLVIYAQAISVGIHLHSVYLARVNAVNDPSRERTLRLSLSYDLNNTKILRNADK